MKNIVILVMIAFYWFLLSLTLTFMAADPALAELATGANFTLTNTSNINMTGDVLGGTATGRVGFLEMTVRMFTFRVPTGIFGVAGNLFVNFINYGLLLLVIVLIYRISLPTSGE